MAEYKTPGVYIEEISTFPASVVRVATAVPVFVGFTELPGPGANKPVKIKSLVEYELLFGGEPTTDGRSLNVAVDATGNPTVVTATLTFYLYQCLRLFFANGGGDAYICSVGVYGTQDSNTRKAALKGPLEPGGVLETVDEPTLILVPDAYGLADVTALGEVQVVALTHCNKMQDRFAILDVKHNTTALASARVLASASDFRDKIGMQYLKYGAAYYPELNTSIGPNGPIAPSVITLTVGATSLATLALASGDTNISNYLAAPTDRAALPNDATIDGYLSTYNAAPVSANKAHMTARLTQTKTVIDLLYGRIGATPTNPQAAAYINAIKPALKAGVQTMLDYDNGFTQVPSPQTALIGSLASSYSALTPDPFTAPPTIPFYTSTGSAATAVAASAAASIVPFRTLFDQMYALLKGYLKVLAQEASADTLYTNSKTMATIRDAVRSTGYTLPPSGAVAGIYAAVDASRGVWKAPANVSLNAVESVRKMAEDELDNYNVDTSGKSINAIRFFRGKGNLVYGARTLAGNDNEWRYVPVRRLFIMVEESVKKATEPFVFEPNDANTWQRAKGMIENFLITLWRDGALAGAVPKDAFFVKVGLGQTMTALDILEGRLIIEIGMAAVRPAEFIILKFSHKLQES